MVLVQNVHGISSEESLDQVSQRYRLRHLAQMAKHSGPKFSEATTRDAMQIALSIQRPGQTKEQTRLIARGIENGIEQYKKREKAKSKERTRGAGRKPANQAPQPVENWTEVIETVRYRQHWLPWTLLALTWLGIGAFALLFRSG